MLICISISQTSIFGPFPKFYVGEQPVERSAHTQYYQSVAWFAHTQYYQSMEWFAHTRSCQPVERSTHTVVFQVRRILAQFVAP